MDNLLKMNIESLIRALILPYVWCLVDYDFKVVVAFSAVVHFYC